MGLRSLGPMLDAPPPDRARGETTHMYHTARARAWDLLVSPVVND